MTASYSHEDAAREPVKRTMHGSVAVLTLHNPPVNTLKFSVRTSLMNELERVENDPGVTAVVLAGASGSFSAGADLGEFDAGQGLAEPSLHATILGYLDDMTKPVVAAISGSALGGGLELALGCHYRVVSEGARLGLPESTFGFMPGAGGTQRLPRAVGLELGLDMIVTGRIVDSVALADTAAIDLLVTGDPLDQAIQFAKTRELERPLPRLRDRDLAHEQFEAFLAFAEKTLRARKGAPVASSAIIEAIRAGATRDTFDRGLATELRLFRELAEAPPARAARYQFFATRAAGRVVEARNTPPRRVESTAVVGAGTMGRGIALALLAAELPVTLVDADETALAKCVDLIEKELERLESKGRVTPEQGAARRRLLAPTTELERVRSADVIIEAVFENLEVKQNVFRALDEFAKPGAVLATNTSSLDVDAIAAVTRRPESVVGMHFFSPANVMRLVEVVQGAATSSETLATALAVAKRLQKVTVVARVGDGFIGNRIIDQYTRQAMQLLSEGATPEQVDTALESFGIRMGPFRVLDLVGNDIPAQARAARGETGDPDWAIAEELVRLGRLGQKTQRGWYRYDGKGRATPDPDVSDMIRAQAAQHGDTQRPIQDREIVDRCVYALVNEGARVLAEGIARRASDIDVAMVYGYGFPAERGGPMFVADTVGLKNVVRTMRGFQERVASHPEFWEPHPLLVNGAESNEAISDWVEKA